MQKNYSSQLRYALAGLALAVSLASCEKSEEKPQTQTFEGQVQLYDQYGDPLTDNGGVTVALEDSAEIATKTTSDGRYTLQAAVFGQHRLSFTKNGYGLYISEPSTFGATSHTLSRRIQLGQIPTHRYTFQYASHDSKGYWVISGKLRPGYNGKPVNWPQNKPRYHRLFLDIALTHGGDPYQEWYYGFSKAVRDNQADGFSDTIQYASMRPKRLREVFWFDVNPYNAKADSCYSVFRCRDNIFSCEPIEPVVKQQFPGYGNGFDITPTLRWAK
ncbi:carboxypeptidase-like regulatory domain-containing protein [Hymenobacter rigui]|uniref:Carboxypeptidase regulatory-like domain-containing protein n=1 Tax=Hymenobacter rigui TaxID=334424 RepID=A0A428KWX8_9BACT|nr:carboxypeptidase-like regulatory domain-containing protein [Hymenobacter rigui]RSK51254.1 carboxypeptidase regulatory-like domain-containing protein [Hymenobacter rigui]